MSIAAVFLPSAPLQHRTPPSPWMHCAGALPPPLLCGCSRWGDALPRLAGSGRTSAVQQTALQRYRAQHVNTTTQHNTFSILWPAFTAFICHFQSIHCPLFLLIIILSDLNSHDSHPFIYLFLFLHFYSLSSFSGILPVLSHLFLLLVWLILTFCVTFSSNSQ